MRKVFTDELPKWLQGSNKDRINWVKSIGYMIRFIYDDIEGWVEIVDYDGKYLYLNYGKEQRFPMGTGGFTNCRFRRLLGKKTTKFKIEIGTTFKDDKRDMTIFEREYTDNPYSEGKKKKYYHYKCNKCGFYDERSWIEESVLLNGGGCSCCRINPRIIVEGINDIPTTAPFMIPYFQGGIEQAKQYTRCSTIKIFPICPDCGRVKDKEITIGSIYNNHSIGCSCSDKTSYPEKLIFNALEQLHVKFKTQLNKTTLNWCDPYRYDFYFKLNDKEYIIEAHGLQHYEETKRKGGRSLECETENDRIKKELALENGIKEENYIVIDCRYSDLEYIKKETIKSELYNIFDLSSIDWIRAEEFALSNRIKEACNIKKYNPHMTNIEIGNVMKLHEFTIRKYLKKGAEFGWCDYNPKEKMRKLSSMNGKKNGKEVEIFKDGTSLGIFPSGTELARQSEKLFEIKLTQNSISEVCIGKKLSYNGYTFSYL